MGGTVSSAEVEELARRLKEEAEAGGYRLNQDGEFVRELVAGLLTNQKRYGYLSCPCRLSSGDYEKKRDLVCPCDYRDADLNDYGTCYCGLYVTQDVLDGKVKLGSIPERRQGPGERLRESQPAAGERSSLPYPVWRCKVCGYLCARKQPPEICPICKVKKDRFETFM